MSGKKRLGKGLDALISGVEEKAPETEEAREEPKTTAEASVKAKKEPIAKGLDEEVIEKAVEEALRNPRVVVWSPRSMIVLRILKKTMPEFSMSKIASELLEEGVKKMYPELWEIAEKYGSVKRR